MPQKRTLDSFFKPAESQAKKSRTETSTRSSSHVSYPFHIPELPSSIADALMFAPAEEPKVINDQPDLDLLYFQPYIPAAITGDYFRFLRAELPFYRVQYSIKRGSIETQINTPRYTTVFGVDASSVFSPDGDLLDQASKRLVPGDRYKCQPRPIPACLDVLRKLTEGSTGETYNFCLVNYYASGNDSISYHSDDEAFLERNPAIASFSLGARRDFLLRHKPVAPGLSSEDAPKAKDLKFPLGPGDMILMRGPTQKNWLHSIPKRKGGEADRGRINITFRKAMVRGGTENYYRYNVGGGPVYKWDQASNAMKLWTDEKRGD